MKFLGCFVFENELITQERLKEDSIKRFKEAIDSKKAMKLKRIFITHLFLEMLHEFLTVEELKPTSTVFQLRAIHARTSCSPSQRVNKSFTIAGGCNFYRR